MILVNVPDVIITGSNSSNIQQIIHVLSTQIFLKDLGCLNYFLGIEVKHFNGGIFALQKKSKDLLAKAHMKSCSLITTSWLLKWHQIWLIMILLMPLNFELLLAVFDTSFSQSRHHTCCHSHLLDFQTPNIANLQDVKCILWYLWWTAHIGIHYVTQSSPILYTFRNMIGLVIYLLVAANLPTPFYLGVNYISWSLKKQNTITRSRVEVEYWSLPSFISFY